MERGHPVRQRAKHAQAVLGRFNGVVCATRSGGQDVRAPSASTVKIATAAVEPIKASGELWGLSQCRFAAHATTAGGVIVRNPAITPMRNARNRTQEGPTEELPLINGDVVLIY